MLATVRAAAEDRPLHVHLSEQVAENDACLEAYGVTPTGLLHDELNRGVGGVLDECDRLRESRGVDARPQLSGSIDATGCEQQENEKDGSHGRCLGLLSMT